MRNFLMISAAALGLTACASQAPAPVAATPAPAPATAAKTEAPAPQCWNGDAGSFMAVGTQAEISGVKVTCEKTADGKNAQWMGKKH